MTGAPRGAALVRGLLHGLLHGALRRLRRLAARATSPVDPWARLDVAPRLAHYGAGARHDVAWYFEGESAVAVETLGDLQSWLAECEYATDHDLFQEPDFWQHPRTFERLRRGDCEDFAIWAWRKLLELGYDADLVVGRCLEGASAGDGRHAWIVFRRDGAEFLFEPVCGRETHAVRPLAEVRGCYVPEFGLGPDRQRFAYAGYRRYWKDRPAGLRSAVAD